MDGDEESEQRSVSGESHWSVRGSVRRVLRLERVGWKELC